jgi:methionyl-tRNA formyltransferase
MHLGADAILETLELVVKGEVEETEQVYTDDLKSAPKLYTETCNIPWHHDGKSIMNLIRGLNPYPTAHTLFLGKLLKIYKTEFIDRVPKLSAGSYATDGKKYLAFACQDGWISILDAKLEGKKRMNIKDLLNGLQLEKIGPDLM